MRRGEIWLVDLEPAQGSEANKRRPCLIVSNDHANLRAASVASGTVTVVPLTSNVGSVFAFQVLLPAIETGLDADSKAQAEQVRTVAVRRFGIGPVGRVSRPLMRAVDAALKLHLALG